MRIRALVGISLIVYISVNIGYSCYFKAQLIRTISSQEPIGSNIGKNIPEFIDEKKFQRPIVSDRYIHDFNYNGTMWPMVQECF